MPVAVPPEETALSSFARLKLNGSATSNYPAFKSAPTTPEAFLARAAEVRDLLATDVAERDHAQEIPYRQVQLLKDAGLVTATGPTKWGGGGQSFATAYKIVRLIAAGDGSVGQLLGYHYLWTLTAQVVGTEAQSDIEAKKWTEGKLFFGAAVNPRDSDLAVTESEDGKSIIFTGKKAFSTGSKVSDLTVLEGVLPDGGTHVFAITESRQPGIQYGDDWKDVLGMRGTQSGSVNIDRVSVPWSSALGFVDKKFVPLGAYNTLLLPTIQLIFINFYLGIAQGSLAKATQYTLKNTRPWPFAGDVKESAKEEFYIQDIYGSLQARTWAVEAQVDRAGDKIEALLSSSPREAVTDQQRGETAVYVAGAKVTATELALEVTSKVYEALGARAVKAGFDHFWRNARTHTLHDPVAHKRGEVGRYALDGTLPTPTWYT